MNDQVHLEFRIKYCFSGLSMLIIFCCLSNEVNSNEVLDQIEFNIRWSHIRWIIWYVVSGYIGRIETYKI